MMLFVCRRSASAASCQRYCSAYAFSFDLDLSFSSNLSIVLHASYCKVSIPSLNHQSSFCVDAAEVERRR